ncbi:unnamed protein product [Tetraodon nigroviridis]|uniref:(spotted green pufferfish) hypothetical protein n=1 Tax=Tetraodon nigroviridis TaxID=99883 RepID=Q4T045_TETNG|nr:unnamed protein product [Tetraodon nigroviridis]
MSVCSHTRPSEDTSPSDHSWSCSRTCGWKENPSPWESVFPQATFRRDNVEPHVLGGDVAASQLQDLFGFGCLDPERLGL